MGDFFITQASLRNLKHRVAKDLPSFPSSHLSEALASSFGEHTYAALRSRFQCAPSIEVPAPSTLGFTRRARELGHGALLRGWRGLAAVPHGRQGARPYKGDRALAWRNIMVAAINAGLEQRVFGLEPDQNFWPGANDLTHGRGRDGQFDFELTPGYPAAAVQVQGGLMIRKHIAGALAAVMLVSTAGCAKMTEPFKDAPRGETNNSPADLITFPDGFSNVATKCDGNNKVYVIYHADAAYGSVAVSPNDPACGGINR